ncbi:hypothetical protein FAES_3396 [Fibrella aestuarina BUZ 2]|uniref:DUF4395 domain-containing protein n=1 Tax=Fibrella aestuarina BUZ 2 TaxID=1166018 RepID=I0KBA1_9BACT|nr:DUF4395 domain-containing protein [Fibrella aestuarina]CCH01404.1 hypothetical protein FAES_3396 [Fibrella aestuarina BUZ 2]
MSKQLICPTDGVQVNETKVRLVAGLVLTIAIVYLLTASLWAGSLLLPLLLLIDFGLRGSEWARYSPLGYVADWLVSALNLSYKGTDQAPKRFAARIGLGFSLLIAGLQLAGSPTLIPTAVLALFAALESGLGFCAGCYVYTLYVRLFPKALN